VIPGRELACKHAINKTCDIFQKSEYGMRIILETESVRGEFEDSLKRLKDSKNFCRSPYKASWCEQFRAVLWRSWLSIIKEPILIKVRLLQTIVRFPLTASIKIYGSTLLLVKGSNGEDLPLLCFALKLESTFFDLFLLSKNKNRS